VGVALGVALGVCVLAYKVAKHVTASRLFYRNVKIAGMFSK
jgi:hypothetical protein